MIKSQDINFFKIVRKRESPRNHNLTGFKASVKIDNAILTYKTSFIIHWAYIKFQSKNAKTRHTNREKWCLQKNGAKFVATWKEHYDLRGALGVNLIKVD